MSSPYSKVFNRNLGMEIPEDLSCRLCMFVPWFCYLYRLYPAGFGVHGFQSLVSDFHILVYINCWKER